MSKVKLWFLPILTCAVMLAAVILPQRLSLWRDEALLNTLHTEELQAENALPTRPLSLPEQMALVSLFEADGDSLTSVTQELGQDSQVEAMVRTELERLCSNGILAPELLPEDLSNFFSYRVYLRMPGTISGASFLVMEGYSKQENIYFSLLLNEEDGYALRLELSHPAIQKFIGEPLDIGTAFLDRLGVENTCVGYGPYDAVFTTPDSTLEYMVSMEGDLLRIVPTPEIERGEATDANIYDSSQSGSPISAQRQT